MNPSELFIRRPVMTTLLTLAMVIFGVIGFVQLPVSNLPSVDFPTIMVTASLPGANPETMAAAVATPLERQFSAIPGLDSMNSTSSLGSTRITLTFALTRDIDAASQDVQTAIAAASRQLPPEMPSPPTPRKVNPTKPVLTIKEVFYGGDYAKYKKGKSDKSKNVIQQLDEYRPLDVETGQSTYALPDDWTSFEGSDPEEFYPLSWIGSGEIPLWVLISNATAGYELVGNGSRKRKPVAGKKK